MQRDRARKVERTAWIGNLILDSDRERKSRWASRRAFDGTSAPTTFHAGGGGGGDRIIYVPCSIGATAAAAACLHSYAETAGERKESLCRRSPRTRLLSSCFASLFTSSFTFLSFANDYNTRARFPLRGLKLAQALLLCLRLSSDIYSI